MTEPITADLEIRAPGDGRLLTCSRRRGHADRAFFDLVYVLAVTQLARQFLLWRITEELYPDERTEVMFRATVDAF